MQFKKFEAEDMRQALTAVKNSLGPDAVIVATRQLPRGMFQKPRLEVTAALEDKPPPAGPSVQQLDEHLEPLRRELRSLRSAMRAQKNDAQTATLRMEIAALRTMVQALSNKDTPQDPWVNVLLQSDVEPTLAQRLVKQARAPRNPPLTELQCMQEVVAKHLPTDDTFFTKQQRVALVGPTGVGKTTTLAKIAAHAALLHDKSVALITLDTYRIGATEHLRQYAQLMQLPLAVAHNDKSFAVALRAHQDVDVLLVDTAGRGPHDLEHINALRGLLRQHSIAPYLTLAAATRRAELRRIVRDYGALKPTHLVFTKLDEAVAMGAMLNAPVVCQLPMAFVTDGQRVPEDLALPDAWRLAQRLLTESTPHVTKRDNHAVA